MKKLIKFFTLIVFTVLSYLVLLSNSYALEKATIIADWATLRSKASNSASAVSDSVGSVSLIYGTEVTILDQSGDFYKVNAGGNLTGFVPKKFVFRESDLKLNDPSYCEILKSVGFDETYCPYLSYLHSKHPNWIFEAQYIDRDFATAVRNEEGLNYVQLTSTYRDIYTLSNKVVEGKNYYAASQKVNEYMLDPRNYLNEKSIFVFEKLGYNPEKDDETFTRNIVTALAGNSFLKNYIENYMSAGIEFRVSPIHLISRSIQEGASNSDYAAVSGTSVFTCDGVQYSGFYNFYNIGANKGVNDGLCYARKGTSFLRPWNTREIAIRGGAKFIGNGYVNKGQDTRYLQKFHTIHIDGYSDYSHQYMAFIFAPYSEGYNVKQKLEVSGVLDYAYTFKIPVYKNMPSKTYQVTLLNNDNFINNLLINGKTINGFDKDVLEYIVPVVDTTTKVNITADISATSTVEGTGEVELTNESTDVYIKVIAENNEERTYKITIRKVTDTTKVEDIIDNIGVKNDKQFIFDLSSNETGTNLVNKIKGVSPNASATVYNQDNTINNGVISTGNYIVIETPISGKVTYNLSVHGDLNGTEGITIVDLLRLQKYLLGKINLEGVQKYAADVNSDGEITIVDLLRLQKHLLGKINL